MREKTPPGAAAVQTRTLAVHMLVAVLALAVPSPAYAQDRNVLLPVAELEHMLRSEPLRIVKAEISRPKAEGDITLKAEVAFGNRQPMRVKLRRAEPGAETFNHIPRYDLAAYELQKLLLDAPEYVVPPTSLRMVPLADVRGYARAAKPTFRGAGGAPAAAAYWRGGRESSSASCSIGCRTWSPRQTCSTPRCSGRMRSTPGTSVS